MRVLAFVPQPQVAMSAGHRDDLAGVQEARRANQPVFDCTRQLVVAAADVAYGGEAALERMTQNPDGVRGPVRLAAIVHRAELDVRAVRVEMRVDETRH